METIVEIIDYWYSPGIRSHWFASTPELDAEIRERYEALWQAATNGELDHWQTSPQGCLALVILLDQFPLNMYRNLPQSFSSEARAIEVAHAAIAKGFDQALRQEQKAFLYMPFMHSEKLADQNLSVKLYTEAGLKQNQHFAEHHRELIRRFGRFPHRNQILGRTSKTGEIEYLSSKNAFTG